MTSVPTIRLLQRRPVPRPRLLGRPLTPRAAGRRRTGLGRRSRAKGARWNEPGAPKLIRTTGSARGIARRHRAEILAAIVAPLILAACAAANKPPPEVPD